MASELKPAGAAFVQPQRSLLDDIFQSVITPGAGPGLIATINGSLLVLVLVLLGMIICGIGEIHAVVLLAFAIGLLLSFNYFIGEVRKAETAIAAAVPTTNSPEPADKIANAKCSPEVGQVYDEQTSGSRKLRKRI